MRSLSLLTRPLALLTSSASLHSPSSSCLFLVPRRTFAVTLSLATWTAVATPSSSTSSALFHSTGTSSAANTQCESNMQDETGYLNATAAAALDGELMSQPGFTLEQLMELAGLSVAQAVYTVMQNELAGKQTRSETNPPHILVICGPGNNGGDGLVAARHLVHFGFSCTVVYPKRSSKQPHFTNLVKQCEDMGIIVQEEMPDDFIEKQQAAEQRYSCVIDSMFGFSFHGTPREPFGSILQQLIAVQDKTTIVAVDVPSGWHVDDGDVTNTGFAPSVLVSLTAPKNCAKHFVGRHFVGGRFVPPALAQKYAIRMPPYPGSDQVMELKKVSRSVLIGSVEGEGWEADYAAFLAEKKAQQQQQAAEKSAAAEQVDDKNFDSKGSSWEVQYASYLAEKEAKEFAEYAKQVRE